VPVAEGFDFLRSIKDEVAIVTFIGRARSGKSFTLNHLLDVEIDAPLDQRFAVGHTDSPKTLGVQLWSVPLEGTEENNKTHVIFMDTEGLGVMPAAYDKTMTLFSVMVASHIVYHMSEYVYHDDVLRLYSIVNLVRHYEKRQMQDVLMPALAWTVQKYSLERDPGGTPRTAFDGIFLKEKANPTDSPAIAQYNETAHVVRTGFPQQSVYLIPPATTNTELYTLLTDMTHDELNPEYVRQMAELKQVLLASPAKKLHSGTRPMTGEELANYAMDLLPSVNEGVEYIGDRVLEAVAIRVSLACKEQYDNIVEHDIELPVEYEILQTMHELIKVRILAQYEDDMIGERNSYTRRAHRATLAMHIDAGLNKLEKDNYGLSYADCMRMVEETMNKISDGDFDAKNIDVYDKAATVAKENLARQAVGPGKEECVVSLHKQLRNMRRTLSTTDTTGRRTSWMFLLVFVSLLMFVAMMTLRSIPFIKDTIVPSLVLVIFWNVLLLTVMVTWSMFEHAPVRFETLAAVVDNTPKTIGAITRLWPTVLCAFGVCGVSYWFVMPVSVTKTVHIHCLKQTTTNDHSEKCAVLCRVDNSPSSAHTLKIAMGIFEQLGRERAVLVVGAKRLFNISLFKTTGSSCICGVFPTRVQDNAMTIINSAKDNLTTTAGQCQMEWGNGTTIATLRNCHLLTGDRYGAGEVSLRTALSRSERTKEN